MAGTIPANAIVVGVDASDECLRAVDFAVEQTHRDRCGIVLVHAYQSALPWGPMLPPLDYAIARSSGSRVVAVAEEYAKAQVSEPVAVTALLSAASTADALVDTSREARLVVLGRSNLHGVERLLAGTPGVSVAARSRCPVVVVPATWRPGGAQERIVVGIDGSRHSWEATDWAFREAARRSAPLVTVQAWKPGPIMWAEDQDFAERLTKRSEAAMNNAIDGWCDMYPEVKVTRVFEVGAPLPTLLEHATGAALLVVGARGNGGIAGLALGHVARGALAAAGVPVAVVKHRWHHRSLAEQMSGEDTESMSPSY